jgi:molecular chaperone HscB
VPSSFPEYFSLFGFEPRFAIDPDRLARAYREVLAQVHPDRYAALGPAERRAAMQYASHANEAYEVLCSDAGRAAYLCSRHGAEVEGSGAAALPLALLEQHMQWRETLAEARAAGNTAAIAELARVAGAERAACVARIAVLIDESADYRAAAAEVRALLFLDKLLAEVGGHESDRAGAGTDKRRDGDRGDDPGDGGGARGGDAMRVARPTADTPGSY